MITLLNTSILTCEGIYRMHSLSVEDAKQLIKEDPEGYLSAIGHKATADIVSRLLEMPVEVNRMEYMQQDGDKALVFKLKQRAPEGKILTVEEVEDIGYDFKLLERIDTEYYNLSEWEFEFNA